MRKKEKKDMGENKDLGNVYEEEEFVIYKTPDGNVRSFGFDINSALLREGKKPMYTIHNQDIFVVDDSKNEVSDLFKHMAVPAGLFYMNTASDSGIGEERGLHKIVEDEEEINDDIYDKLMDLVTEMEKRRKNKETQKARPEKKVKKTTRKKR
jgi:hypothetical protein